MRGWSRVAFGRTGVDGIAGPIRPADDTVDLSAVRLERVFAMYRIAAVLLSALPSIAQHPAQHGDPSSPKRVALTHGCGLRSGSAPDVWSACRSDVVKSVCAS